MSSDSDKRSNRIAGWSGVVFSVLSLAVIPIVVVPPTPPVVGAPGVDVALWFDSHRVGFLVGNYLGIVAFFFGFVQLAVLAARVRRAEGEGGWLASLVLGTGTFAYAVFACSLIVFQALPFMVAPHLNGPIEAIGSLAAVWFSLDGLGALPMILAVGWATLATNALPRWFAHFSWIVAILAFVMSLGAFTTSPPSIAAGGGLTGLGFLAFFVWTLVLGVLFLRKQA